jgi:hypothetical protein
MGAGFIHLTGKSASLIGPEGQTASELPNGLGIQAASTGAQTAIVGFSGTGADDNMNLAAAAINSSESTATAVDPGPKKAESAPQLGYDVHNDSVFKTREAGMDLDTKIAPPRVAALPVALMPPIAPVNPLSALGISKEIDVTPPNLRSIATYPIFSLPHSV